MTQGTFNKGLTQMGKTPAWQLPEIDGQKLKIYPDNCHVILNIVADKTGVTVEQMKSARKDRPYANARSLACFFYRRFTGLSVADIGKIINRDHSSVLAAIRRTENYLQNNYDDSRRVAVRIYREVKALTEENKPMTVAWICHPIAGDVQGNIDKILAIVRDINLNEPHVVPFAPYITDVQAMDDANTYERARGLRNGLELIRRGFIDECRVYGDRISSGMKDEIIRFMDMDVLVKPMDIPAAEALMEVYEGYITP